MTYFCRTANKFYIKATFIIAVLTLNYHKGNAAYPPASTLALMYLCIAFPHDSSRAKPKYLRIVGTQSRGMVYISSSRS